jgi:hypothetical protein
MRFLIFVAALLFSSFSFSADYNWFVQNYGAANNFSTPKLACEYAASRYVYGGQSYAYFSHSLNSNSSYGSCVIKSIPSGWTHTMTLERAGSSCATGTTYNITTGVCDAPVNPCTAKTGTPSKYFIEYDSFEISKPIGETVNNDGCTLTVSSLQCATSGETGKFACFGVGVYTGAIGLDTESTSNPCLSDTDPACVKPQPIVSTNSQNCTPNVDGNYTCVTDSKSTEFAASQCSVGSTGGSVGVVCVKSDYQPSSIGKTREDAVATISNPDGSSTVSTETTTTTINCAAGACTTTTTKGTESVTTAADGQEIGKESTCEGSDCEGPEKEEVAETGGAFSGSEFCTGECGSNLDNPMGDVISINGYDESTQFLLDGISSSPLLSSISGIHVGDGVCPVYSIPFMGKNVQMDIQCTIYPPLFPVISSIMFAVWAFLGIRIVLSA